MKLLVIIPACNEARSLRAFLPRLRKVVDDLPIVTDVVVVDDGSTDDTVAAVRENGFCVSQNGQNKGIGHSLRIGYKIAINRGFDFLISLDADGQHDENYIPTVLEPLMEGKSEIVIASRYHEHSERINVPIDRDLLNIAMAAQIRVVTGWELSDPLSGFWGMSQRCFQFTLEHARQDRYGIHLENLVKFWYLCDPRPEILEIPHPAIYGDDEAHKLLTRTYSPNEREKRIDRFGTHANHVVEALEDVKRHVSVHAVNAEIFERRSNGRLAQQFR